MSSQVFPRRNLPESSEDWGRKVEDQIRELSKENTLIKSTLSNLNRTMSGVGSALSATRRQTAFATKSAQAAAEGVQTVWDEVHNPARKEEQGIPLDSLAGWRAFYEDWTLADVALENGILSLEAPEDQGLYILSPPLDVTGGDWRVAVDVRAMDESTSGTVELGTFPVEENGEFTSLVSHEFVPADPWTPPEDDDIDPEPYESPTEWVSLAGTVTVEGPQQLSLALYIPPGVTYEARTEVPGESEGEDPTVVVSTSPAPLEWRRFGMYEVTALEEARKVLAQMAQEAAEHAQQALDTLAQLEPRLDDAEQDLFDAIIDFEQKRSALEAVVNTIGQTADTATQNAQQAHNTAVEAMLSASGKNSIIRSTLDASGSVHPQTGQPNVEGDEWWKLNVLNAAGRTVGRWQWDGSTWVPVKISHEVIDSVDVNQLKVHGTAAIDTAVIEKFWAEMAHIVKLTANQILVHPGNEFPDPYFEDTAGWTGDGVALIQDASVPGNVLQITGTTTVRGSYYHDLTDAGKTMALRPGDKYRVTLRRKSSVLARDIEMRLISSGETTQTTIPRNSVADTWEEVSFEITAPTGVGKALPSFHTRTTLGSGVIQIADVRVTSMVDGTLITPGSITSPHLNITDTAWMSDAVIGDLVGRTAFLEYLNALDIVARRVLVRDDDGGVTVALGADDEQIIQIPAADGGIGATIDNAGSVSGKNIRAAESLTYRGEELYKLLDGSSETFEVPRVVAHGFGGTGFGRPGDTGPILTAWKRVVGVTFPYKPGRAYQVDFSGLNYWGVAGGRIAIKMCYSFSSARDANGDFIAPAPPSAAARSETMWSSDPMHTSGHIHSSPPMFHSIANPTEGYEGIISYAVFVRSLNADPIMYGSRFGDVSWGRQINIVAKDIGSAYVPMGESYYETDTIPKPTLRPVTRTVTFYANGFRSYFGNGQPHSGSGPGASYAMQGYTSYSPNSGRQSSMVTFPDMTKTLAGATINKAELRINTPHWNYGAGGTLCIHRTPWGGLSGTAPGSTTLMGHVNFGRNETKWITLAQAHANAIRDGQFKSLAFVAPDNSGQYYGYATANASDANRPAIRITYTRME